MDVLQDVMDSYPFYSNLRAFQDGITAGPKYVESEMPTFVTTRALQ